METLELVFAEFLHEHMALHIEIICMCMAATIAGMGVDLVYGIAKAKQLGIARTSTGYKKTCDKARKYFLPFAVLMLIDLIACYVLPAPFFSMIWTAYCLFCEFKSVREKAWTKAELRKAEKTMNIVIENKDELAKVLAELVLGSKSTSGSEETTTENATD